MDPDNRRLCTLSVRLYERAWHLKLPGRSVIWERTTAMRSIDSHALLPEKPRFPWKRYVLDTLLALLGSMVISAVIFFNLLYPRIPNISIVYLLVVLPLAIARGRYSAMLTSVLAFLAFDFFLVPPLYLFTVNRPEEWIALFI